MLLLRVARWLQGMHAQYCKGCLSLCKCGRECIQNIFDCAVAALTFCFADGTKGDFVLYGKGLCSVVYHVLCVCVILTVIQIAAMTLVAGLQDGSSSVLLHRLATCKQNDT